MFYEVIPKKVFGKGDGFLTYSSDESLLPGQIVIIPLGKGTTIGVVYKKVVQPNFPTKKIIKLLYSTPLPEHILKTIVWMSEYYLIPMPLALNLMLPKGIEKTRRKTFTPSAKTEQNLKLPIIDLNTAQKNALKSLQEAPESTKLLHGVTGSGKTNIYLELAKNALKQQKSTILLVPEIALTSQLVRVFEEFFGQKVKLIHSQKTESERHQIWEKILESTEPNIIVGPRSALFTPVKNLGLIIIDECHESSYYQENAPKYSTSRIASFMAKTLGIDCIEGSATPSITDYYLAKTHNSLVQLNEKALKTAREPQIKIIDFKDRANFTKNRYFCTELLDSIEDNLKNHRQTLIFHNRRGSSPLSICEDCGEELLCPHCFLPLTLHADTFELLCHTCGYKQKVPRSCPNCGSINILHKGFGTKLLESELNRLFKNARVARFDADNGKLETLNALYDEIKNGSVDIIVGTQTVAKGLDLPKLATVGIVQADAGLSLPDFSSKERVFELITQVIGRVGRGHQEKAEVFIQTFKPDSNVLALAAKNDYCGFAESSLSDRKKATLPPFAFLAKLEISYKTEALAVQKIRQLRKSLAKNPDLIVSAETPAFHEKNSRGYTWQVIVRAKSRTKLLAALKGLDPTVRITLDPPSLLWYNIGMKIITTPDPRLREKSTKVSVIDDEILDVIKNMKKLSLDWENEHPYELSAAMAAPQMGVNKRIIIVRDDMEDKENANFTALINPEVIKTEGKTIRDYEGCLSVPRIYALVERPAKAKIKAMLKDGTEVRIKAENDLARVLLHEIDHLNGILFIDHAKDDKDAFYEMNDKGDLVKIKDYETEIKNNKQLFPDED